MRFKLYRATPSFCYFENHPYTIMHNRANPNSAHGNCSGCCAILHSAYTCKLIPYLVAIYNQIVFPGPLRGVYSLLSWLLVGKLLWWFCEIVGYAKLLLSRSQYMLYVHVQCMFDVGLSHWDNYFINTELSWQHLWQEGKLYDYYFYTLLLHPCYEEDCAA